MLLSVLKVWMQLSAKMPKSWHLQAAAASTTTSPIINIFVTTAAIDAFRTKQKQKRVVSFLLLFSCKCFPLAEPTWKTAGKGSWKVQFQNIVEHGRRQWKQKAIRPRVSTDIFYHLGHKSLSKSLERDEDQSRVWVFGSDMYILKTTEGSPPPPATPGQSYYLSLHPAA